MGIIDQWGNGLKLIADELKNYPNIELKWSEVGAQFQLQFVNKAFDGLEIKQLNPETGLGLKELGLRLGINLSDDAKSEELSAEKDDKSGLSWDQAGTKLGLSLEKNGTRLDELSAEKDTKSENGTRLALGLEKNGTRLTTNLAENDTQKLDWEKIGTRLAKIRHQAGEKMALGYKKNGTKSTLRWLLTDTKSTLSEVQLEQTLIFCENARTIQEMMDLLSFKDRTKFRIKYIKPFLELELIAMTLPEIPSSPKQKYYTTQLGKDLLNSKLSA
jgi:hypothetical protein